MTGRQENDLKIEKKIELRLKDASPMIKNYYYNFSGKTAMTADAYVRYVLEFAKFFEGQDLTKLAASDIKRYMKSIERREVNGKLIENSASIRNAKLAAIKDFYSYLVEDRLIDYSPAAQIKPPKSAALKKPVYMTPKEINQIKETIKETKTTERRGGFRGKDFSNRDLAIFTLGCSTGIRVGSIVEINVSDVDFQKKTIHVTEKGDKERTIPIGTKTLEVIKDWIEDRSNLGIDIQSDALFISKGGKRMGRVDVYNVVKKYTEDLDKNITPHKMRSSCATNLYEQTGDIYLTQEVLGHSNIANTKRYAAVSDAKLEKAAQILDDLY